jgi:uncharacterized protein
VNDLLRPRRAGYGAAMSPARTKEETELLTLFEESGRNVRHASGLLRDLFAEYPDRPELAREVLDCEHEGDRIAHEILSRLAERGSRDCNLDPADVHALTCSLDDIVDHAEEAADQLIVYRIEAPMEQALELADVLVGACEQVACALSWLRSGVDLAPRLVEIHRLENEGDRVSRDAVASLFEGGIDPMVVIRWKDIFDALEAAVDSCEKVAHILEGVALRRR